MAEPRRRRRNKSGARRLVGWAKQSALACQQDGATTDMPEQNDQQSQQLQTRYSVRQVTDIQASWVEQARGQRGRFTLQLILDNGVEEYILEPDADDLDVLVKLFARSDHTTFDLERKVLMFSNLSVE
jgi:hypothetical protein